MAENVIDNLEVRQNVNVLLATAREGVTAVETASGMIEIPSREKAKIQTAVKKMREATNYIENRAHNIPVKSSGTTKSALKEALKDASQEQIERAYAILSGQESVEDVPADEEEDYLPPVEWDEE